LAALALAAPAAPAAAPADVGDMVGVLDPQKVIFQHPKFDSVAKHITELSRQKESEVRLALGKEADPEKKADILRAANQEMAGMEEHLMSPIHEDCKNALSAIMKKKKITIVLKHDAVYFGGMDVTEDVVAQMKAAPKNR
jgi:outer membrane protein